MRFKSKSQKIVPAYNCHLSHQESDNPNRVRVEHLEWKKHTTYPAQNRLSDVEL